MANDRELVKNLLNTHYQEALGGIVDKAPSRLARGEGTEKDFYIFKIDLVGSTGLLYGRRTSTYLKVAHTYLSTVDKITQAFGADPAQVEYAGDSVLAYFAADSVKAESVLFAATYCRYAVKEMSGLDQTLNGLNLKTKIVLHFGKLIVAKIGPRAASLLTAIGHPIHVASKLEGEVKEMQGIASVKFFEQVGREARKYFSPIHPSPSHIAASGLTIHNPPQTLRGLLSGLTIPPAKTTAELLNPTPTSEPVGYSINWAILHRELGIPLG